MDELEVLRLTPIFQPRVWGGNRLDPDAAEPIGESWVVYEGNLIENGRWAGRTLADAAWQMGVRLLGNAVVRRTGDHFPLLIKLLDSREWLSVQVHPNDEQAARLEGLGTFGKTEAWHVLEAAAGARVVFGLEGDLPVEDLRRLAEQGSLKDALRYVSVSRGDTLFTPAGTVHAIGPGLFIYEVQQTSDITYRLYDWDRPLAGGRELHLEKGLQVIQSGVENPCPVRRSSGASQRTVVAECEYFALDRISLSDESLVVPTGGESFHALTVVEGDAMISCSGGSTMVNALETVLVPAGNGHYEIAPLSSCTALVAYVPGSTNA